ncbi:two-component system histidine kinase PnpS [Alkalihalobacterium elongatum]|uniref:two-component system histidine kinase PnpS n=1 Tax=Alkalihalobacterium elongatum TaxID=2675466 RepID=UPI001C200EAE|nr:ATP-binding protein [Alkalihalobacterium elongatum]
MGKFRFRLVFSLLAVTLIVLASLGLIIGQLFKEFYFESITDRLKKEAELAGFSVLEVGLDNQEQSQGLAIKIGNKLDTRVTIILADGSVVGETATDPKLMENHINRPEIRSVIEGVGQYEVRYSETVGKELLYYAVPIDEGGETIGFLRLGIPLEELNKMNQKIWGLLIFSFSLAFFVIVSVSFRIANQMIRPIEAATKVANSLAEGNYKARTMETSQDEVGQLSRSINVLAYNLDQITRRHQIQQERMETLIENMGSGLIFINPRGDISLINRSCKDIFQEDTDLWLNRLYHEAFEHKEIIKIVQDIFMTENKQRKQVKLPIHLEVRHFDVYGAPIIGEDDKLRGIALVFHDITELKKLEQVRKDFVANVSHELKTPVTSIRGFTETLLDGAMEEPQLREQFLTIIWKESERLQNLIHDLLELSRIEQQYFKLNWQKTNVSDIVEDVQTLLKPKADEKDIHLNVECIGDTVIDGDPIRIKQIVINLVNNSITYTPAGGEIFVEAKEQGDEVILIVKDTGIGISESELPRIFERFYRVDRARSRNSGGTGLGLAIVKHLVEAHHGKIDVESTVGKGTLFSITLKKEVKEESSYFIR